MCIEKISDHAKRQEQKLLSENDCLLLEIGITVPTTLHHEVPHLLHDLPKFCSVVKDSCMEY